ncbi:GTP-binding proten HflX [Thermodesulfatator indicus DSM 15286]|uniref:GTPase HflX n=1 Tax=Thermodesulfatator indicus (strain DSM 15286 / JCM 11887 / CIR29812) TaxID=667014 RepID=F8A9F0_THEID|nr:GTPase HflX [Thermodesulfatator indicus]AEH44091.1 GTP-binding proten HflX [Thermodesulfatator indicus DSM 15286]
MSKTLYGNTSGLKPSQIKRLERLYRRRVSPSQIISHELSKELAALSHELNRQLGILINRRGEIEFVIVGEHGRIVIPAITRYRESAGRLRGLRLIHTHLSHEGLDQDDLLDLAFLRLDLIGALMVKEDGFPGKIYLAHLLPAGENGRHYGYLPTVYPWELKEDFLKLISSLEDELERQRPAKEVADACDRAILISVTTRSRAEAEESLAELKELARSAGVTVLDTIIQRRHKVDPRYLMGKGKLSELIIRAMQVSANLLIFDQELTPSQMRSITEVTEMRVIDRTQLILDIFAQRAKSREGKIQVEMAQLRYLLPRLRSRDDAFSRLTGGIGGRGPGETKLEIDRRRIKDRIARLERELKNISSQRKLRRKRRQREGLPVVAIVGYTNAGKTTFLNQLTKSDLLAEDKLFATLDPASRRVRLPDGSLAIFTDTVGFIKDLPKDLERAFRATLEELYEADLLLHLVDASNPYFEEHIQAVEKILEEMNLEHLPRILVLNKIDLLDELEVEVLKRRYQAEAISALDKETFAPLLEKINFMLLPQKKNTEREIEYQFELLSN